MTSQEIIEITAKNTFGTWRFQKGWKPLHITDAEGCYFIDARRKEIFGFFLSAHVRNARA